MAFTFGQQYDTSQVRIIGINRGEDLNTVEQFIESFGITYPVILDSDGSVWVTYKIQGISPFPLDCIIDQNGIVQYLNTEYDPQVMLSVVNNLLSTNPTPPPDDEEDTVPKTLEIALFPNPTNSATIVQFTVLQAGEVELTLYDATGRQVMKENLGMHSPGETITYRLALDKQASSIYVVSVQNGSYRDSKKLVLVR